MKDLLCFNEAVEICVNLLKSRSGTEQLLYFLTIRLNGLFYRPLSRQQLQT